MSQFSLQDWIDTPEEFFDVSAEYDEQVEPLVEKLKQECERLGIPMILQCFVSNTPETESVRGMYYLHNAGRASKRALIASQMAGRGMSPLALLNLTQIEKAQATKH